MSEGLSYSPGSPLPAEKVVMQLPATFANHFHVMGGVGAVRLVFGETADNESYYYRGAIVMSPDAAKALATLLLETTAKVDTAVLEMAKPA